ncbi:unnamed protein product, partial [marine sediment metagenome]
LLQREAIEVMEKGGDIKEATGCLERAFQGGCQIG